MELLSLSFLGLRSTSILSIFLSNVAVDRALLNNQPAAVSPDQWPLMFLFFVHLPFGTK
jgi:hypothetical protein